MKRHTVFREELKARVTRGWSSHQRWGKGIDDGRRWSQRGMRIYIVLESWVSQTEAKQKNRCPK